MFNFWNYFVTNFRQILLVILEKFWNQISQRLRKLEEIYKNFCKNFVQILSGDFMKNGWVQKTWRTILCWNCLTPRSTPTPPTHISSPSSVASFATMVVWVYVSEHGENTVPALHQYLSFYTHHLTFPTTLSGPHLLLLHFSLSGVYTIIQVAGWVLRIVTSIQSFTLLLLIRC